MENNNKVANSKVKRNLKNLSVLVGSTAIAILFLMFTGATVSSLLVFACWMVFYLIPSFIASIKRHQSYKAIIILNMFFGWTLFGWIFVLIWSLTGDIEDKNKELGNE